MTGYTLSYVSNYAGALHPHSFDHFASCEEAEKVAYRLAALPHTSDIRVYPTGSSWPENPEDYRNDFFSWPT